MAFDTLKGFLDTEIASVNSAGDQEMYIAIRYFLVSFEIREGKFEANEYVISKLNRDTVIIYQEYELPTGWEYSKEARIISIPELIGVIDETAMKNGLAVPTD